MNRNDAKMIAEELHKLIRKEMKKLATNVVQEETDEYLDSKEAAEFMGVSISFVKKNILDIPHTKVGRLNKFKKSALVAFLNR